MKTFSSKMVFNYLVIFNIFLVILYVASSCVAIAPLQAIRRLFDLNGEANIPTWFSSAQLFSIFLLSTIYSLKIENKHLGSFYFLFGFVFLFFSADETSMIHEGVTSFLDRMSIHSFFPSAHGMWILVYPVILAGLGFVFWRGILAFWNEQEAKKIFITGAIVFVVGGVFLEVLGYYLAGYETAKSLLHVIQVAVEESCEMLGQSLMIYALLLKHNALSQRQAAANDFDRLLVEYAEKN